MSTLYLDFETHSRCALKGAGALAYAEHPSTRILCLCWTIDAHPVETWWPEEPLPDSLAMFAADPATRVVAHNIGFDRAIWDRLMPLPPMPLERWSCTAFRARLERLPGNLDQACVALGLPYRKDAVGKRLLQAIIKRDLASAPLSEGERARLGEYCVGDVEALRALDQALPEMPAAWAPLFSLNEEINARGMPLDNTTVTALIALRDAENARLIKRFRQLTYDAVKSPRQVQVLRAWLAERGHDLPNLKTETLEQWRDEHPDQHDAVGEVIDIRYQLARSADAKLETMLLAAAGSGRVRDGFVLHGAHTGRYSGRGVQLQNLRRAGADGSDAGALLKALINRSGRPPRASDFPLPMPVKDAIGSVLRGCFKAPPGWTFVAADFGQIESRVLCWLAGQDNVLNEYKSNNDVYAMTSERLHSADRNLGKLLVLACGYGASSKVVLERAPGFGVTLTADEAARYTERWRKDNSSIVRFWYALFDQVHRCVVQPPGEPVSFRHVNLWHDGNMLYLQLPSGRCLKYRRPAMVTSDRASLVMKTYLPKGKNLVEIAMWHGAVVENVVQAVAFDVMAEAMLKLHQDGVFLVGTVHDEIIALAPIEEAEAIRDHMLAVMRTPPDWAEGLPLDASAFVNERYLKPAKDADHASLAPSAAERWMRCPGSIAAARLLPPAAPSAAALIGTEAHRIVAECLTKNVTVASLSEDHSLIDPLRHAVMLARNIIDRRRFLVEHRLAAEKETWGPGLWGTADIIVFNDDGLVTDIIDFKFGLGIIVEPSAIQLKIYGILAAQEFGCPERGITLHIIQPRRNHTDGVHRQYHLTLDRMTETIAKVATSIADTELDNAPRKPGLWCQFCPANAVCPEYKSWDKPVKSIYDNPYLAARSMEEPNDPAPA